jgi:hypothetical protein
MYANLNIPNSLANESGVGMLIVSCDHGVWISELYWKLMDVEQTANRRNLGFHIKLTGSLADSNDTKMATRSIRCQTVSTMKQRQSGRLSFK